MNGEQGKDKERRFSVALSLLLLLQSTATIFFVGDAVADFMVDPGAPHSVVEVLVAVALIAGIIVSIRQLRLALAHVRAQERALETARGSLAEVIETQFSQWKLTPAERDVGLLALKGLDVNEIAEIRGAAQGTVRAQLTRIYAKAGVSGRAQFASWFVEDLLQAGATQ